ncbi:MAG: hypothetical protein GEU97_00870 [Actinophytocola sp.]|nr:hypothetical protein [Actinophytocola sp.]
MLANHAAVALHNSFLLHATTRLRGRTAQLSETAEQRARDLAARNAELAETQQRLIAAMQRQALDDERHRIARELHDSVTQDVLSAGMTIELCRSELLDGPDDVGPTIERLGAAKDLTRHAVERLRAAIYALHHTAEESSGSLPVLLQRLSTVHLPSDLKVQVRVSGEPVALPGEAEHSLLRLTGEALFNTVMHTTATQAQVRLRYQARSCSRSPTTATATRRSFARCCGSRRPPTSAAGTGDWRTWRRASRTSTARCRSASHASAASCCGSRFRHHSTRTDTDRRAAG